MLRNLSLNGRRRKMGVIDDFERENYLNVIEMKKIGLDAQ